MILKMKITTKMKIVSFFKEKENKKYDDASSGRGAVVGVGEFSVSSPPDSIPPNNTSPSLSYASSSIIFIYSFYLYFIPTPVATTI